MLPRPKRALCCPKCAACAFRESNAVSTIIADCGTTFELNSENKPFGIVQSEKCKKITDVVGDRLVFFNELTEDYSELASDLLYVAATQNVLQYMHPSIAKAVEKCSYPNTAEQRVELVSQILHAIRKKD